MIPFWRSVIPKRVPIPNTLAAKVLFESDRTCCVCRKTGKPVQIHHVDEDHSNSTYENLAVLCFDCHTDTQIKGGFHRKLDAEQVVLYRSDWRSIVSRGRAIQRANATTDEHKSDLGSLVKSIENLKAKKDYEELIFVFDNLGQTELRDKYIDLYLKKIKPFEEQFYFRSIQGRIDLLNQDELKQYFIDQETEEDWQELSRAYFRIGDKVSGTKFFCKHVYEGISRGNLFNAAFCFRELLFEDTVSELFEAALVQKRSEKDLFWELRSLQELGWTEELMKVLKNNLTVIDEDPSRPWDMFEPYLEKVRSGKCV